MLISSRVLERNKRHFKMWHRAFHGTKADKVAKILDIGDLVMPGRFSNIQLMYRLEKCCIIRTI